MQNLSPVPAPKPPDGDDYTYAVNPSNLFHWTPVGAPWPDQVDAEIATLKAQVRDLQRIVHRLLNPAGEDPDCDRSGSY